MKAVAGSVCFDGGQYRTEILTVSRLQVKHGIFTGARKQILCGLNRNKRTERMKTVLSAAGRRLHLIWQAASVMETIETV